MAFDYKDIDGSLQHVISELTRLDAGDGQAIDFITRKDVNAFCALLGIQGLGRPGHGRHRRDQRSRLRPKNRERGPGRGYSAVLRWSWPSRMACSKPSTATS